MEIIAQRVSRNPQVKTFRSMNLPERVRGVDENGNEYIHTFVNEYGEPKGFSFDDGGRAVLNDENPFDRQNLEGLRAFLRKGLSSELLSFVIEDTNAVAQKENDRRNMTFEVMMRLAPKKDDTIFMASVARRLGMGELNKRTVAEVSAFVGGACETTPQRVAAILDDAYQEMHFAIDEALENGTLRTDVNGIFFYGQAHIGTGEESVVEYFNKYPEMYAEVRRRNGKGMIEADSKLTWQINTPANAAAEATESPFFSPPAAPAISERQQAEELFNRATTVGLVKAGEMGDKVIYRFDRVPMTASGLSEDAAEQAVLFLMNPKNKTQRRALENQLDRLK